MIVLISLVFFFLILRFSVTLFNFISNPKLTAQTRNYNDFISVLVPVRDEEDTILRLLKSINEQDYQHYEVIILDDSSTDNTYEICSNFCSEFNRFRVVKGDELKTGWLGKNFACHQLAAFASGQYLLFLDADEKVENGLFNNAIHRMKMNKLTLLSLFANQQMNTIGERAVVPLMHFILLNLLPLRLVKLFKNASFSAASGQFMLFDAFNYKQNLWHKAVKGKVVEDIEIMRLIKVNGFKGEALLANGFISCRMYTGFEDALNGFSKNILAGFNNSLPGLLLYLILVIAGPLLIMLSYNLQLMIFAGALIVITRMMISSLAGQNPVYNIILHPVQMLALLTISILSIQKSFNKSLTWKGRNIQT